MSNKKKCDIVLEQSTRQIINDVDKYFQSEKELANQLLLGLHVAGINRTTDGNVLMTKETYDAILKTLNDGTKVMKRVVTATGVKRETIMKIRKSADPNTESTSVDATRVDEDDDVELESDTDPLQGTESLEDRALADGVEIVCEPSLDNLCYAGPGSPNCNSDTHG